MEQRGWLKSKSDPQGGPRARKDYRLTPKGKAVLDHVREQLKELYEEVAGAYLQGAVVSVHLA